MAALSAQTNKILQDIAENKNVLDQKSDLANNTELVKYVKDLLNRWAEKNKVAGFTKLEGEKFDDKLETALVRFGKEEKLLIEPKRLGFRALGRLLGSVEENERLAGISTLTSAKRGEELLSINSLNKDRTRFGADLAEAAMNAWVKEITPIEVAKIVEGSKGKIKLTAEEITKGLNPANKQYDEKFPEFVKAFQTWYNSPPAKGTPELVVDGVVGSHTTAAAKKYIEIALKEPAKAAAIVPGLEPPPPMQVPVNEGVGGVPAQPAPQVQIAASPPPAPPAPAPAPAPAPTDALPIELRPEQMDSIKKNPELVAILTKAKEMEVTIEEGAERSSTLKILQRGKLVDQLSIGMMETDAQWQANLKGKLEEIIDPTKRTVYIVDKTNSGIDFSKIIKTGDSTALGWYDTLKEKGITISLIDKEKGVFEFRKGDQVRTTKPIGAVTAESFVGMGTAIGKLIPLFDSPQEVAQENSPIPAGTQKPDLSQKLAKAWYDKHIKVAEQTKVSGDGGLIDGSKYISSDGAKVMAGYANQKGEGLTFTDNGPNETFRFKIQDPVKGETWNVTTPPSYPDQHGTKGPPFDRDHVVFSKVGSHGKVQLEVPSTKIFKDGKIDFSAVKEVLAQAEGNRNSEMADSARMNTYDMSSTPIGYIGLVDPNKTDPVLNGIKEDLKFAPNLYNSLPPKDGKPRYHIVTMNGSESIDVTSDPAAILRAQISAMKEKGINEFRINLAGHGNADGVHFGNGMILKPAELAQIFKENPSSKFILDTVACEGAGLAKMTTQFRDVGGEPGRIQIRLQAKETAYNQEGRLKNDPGVDSAPKTFSTYYNVFYFEALREGLSDGQAHNRADVKAKALSPCDAEVWMSSSQGWTVNRGISIQ